MARIGDIITVENTEKHQMSKDIYKCVRVQYENGVESTLLFTEHEISIAEKRAQNNQEDIPKISWIRDILD